MKAILIDKYGSNDVVRITDIPVPSPGPDEIMIKVRAAAINPVDWKTRNGSLRLLTGSRFPMILGRECAGEVFKTGAGVKKFTPGAEVIGIPALRRHGAFAEYACVPAQSVFRKPGRVSFEQAASIPVAGLTALQALRDRGHITAGQRVLINGASGGVGHIAVQIAKTAKTTVTGVCSGANVDFVKSLGANRVIDYTKQDFTEDIIRYDIVFDAVAKRSFGEVKKVLAPKGIYISTLPSIGVIVNQFITGHFTGKKARLVMVRPNEADIDCMNRQIEAGVIKIIIDKTFPFDQAKEALAYSETQKAKGKIVLTLP